MLMLVLEGITKLPIRVKSEEALQILELLSEVNHKIGRLEEKFQHSIVNQGLVQILLLSESVESSRIEGTQVTFTNIVEEQNDANPRKEITEVQNYREALQEGAERINNGYPVSSRLIKDLHTILMKGARGSTQSSGDYRKVQNFIGPTNKIEDATYIPIPADEIEGYMQNLELFVNKHPYNKRLSTNHLPKTGYIFDENANPLIKTAIMHAQFESIHPFLDGNGRIGRILIVLSLMQSDLITQPIFFVSEELEEERALYYDMLNGVRGNNPQWGDWIIFFLKACDRMVVKVHQKLEGAERLAKEGLMKCKLESEKSVWLYTFADPFTTAVKAANQLDISANTARKALNSLTEKRLLFTEREVKRNKKYRNYDLMRILRG